MCDPLCSALQLGEVVKSIVVSSNAVKRKVVYRLTAKIALRFHPL